MLFSAYPKLREAGGFQLCRCLPNSRQLDVLTPIAHSSPSVLKEHVGNSKTYIRPLQKNLSLDSVFELTEGVCDTIVCMYMYVLLFLAKRKVFNMWKRLLHW